MVFETNSLPNNLRFSIVNGPWTKWANIRKMFQLTSQFMANINWKSDGLKQKLKD